MARFRQLATVSFDPAGARKVTRAPSEIDTLKRLVLTSRDIDPAGLRAVRLDLGPPSPTATPVYSGRQQIDDHNAAVFDLLPRMSKRRSAASLDGPWVWIGQNAVLRTCGRYASLPIGPLRWQVQRVAVGENWFPSLIRADENLRVGDKDVHIRVSVQYAGYKGALTRNHGSVAPAIVGLLLAAALMHASWNALLKSDRSDRLATVG